MKMKIVLCDTCLKKEGCKWAAYIKSKPNTTLQECHKYVKNPNIYVIEDDWMLSYASGSEKVGLISTLRDFLRGDTE